MGVADYLRFLLAFAVTLALIGVAYWAVRRFGSTMLPAQLGPGKRLKVVETTYVDGRRKLVLVRLDHREHLLLVGGETDVVIDAGLDAPQTDDPSASTAMASGQSVVDGRSAK